MQTETERYIPNREDELRPKLTIEEQIAYMRDKKGIKFTIVSEEEAAEFLREHNYYFKLKAYAKNFGKYASGDNKGKYCDLEFAYLQELSTLDMYLREQLMKMSLAIEHYLKVKLLKDIAENSQEDGYAIVERFFDWNPTLKDELAEKAKNSYCQELVTKYGKKYPAWALVEVLPFGKLIEFCDCYYRLYDPKGFQAGDFKVAKFLRNACAHNNCLLNILGNNSGVTFQQNRGANKVVSEIPGISANVRNKKMGNRVMHDFVVFLCCFCKIVTSKGVRKHLMQELQILLEERFSLNREYFIENAALRTNYEFAKKVVDKFAEICI